MRRMGFWAAMIGVCVLAISGGCAKQEKAGKPTATKVTSKSAAAKVTGKPVMLAEKFNTGDLNTYKVVTETVKDYKFEEPSKNQTKTQQTLNRIEIVFDRQIQSVESGDATALVTIKELKYVAKNPKGTTLDFDSTKQADNAKPLAKLVGQSYVVKLSPNGDVLAISDTQKALDSVKGDAMEQKIAQSLLSDSMIKERHAILAMPDKKDSKVRVGQSWSKLKASPVGMLVPKSYEEVYTLKQVQGQDGHQVAVVDMEARPTSAKAPNASSEEMKGMGFFSKMFDNKETYTGKMQMDLSTGQISSYNEKLKSEWVAAEPAEEVKSDKGPDVLTMGFTYSHELEKIK